MNEFSFEQAIGAMLQDPEQMQKIFALAQSLGFSPPAAQGASSPPEPLLKPERREKIDRAMQAARISRLAGAALRGRDQKE